MSTHTYTQAMIHPLPHIHTHLKGVGAVLKINMQKKKKKWIIYQVGSWRWVLWQRRMWPCVVGDLWHHCCSAYMPMNIANPPVNCSFHTSGGLPWSINQLGNGQALLFSLPFLLYLHLLSVSSPLCWCGEEAVTWRRSQEERVSETVVCFVLQCATRSVA